MSPLTTTARRSVATVDHRTSVCASPAHRSFPYMAVTWPSLRAGSFLRRWRWALALGERLNVSLRDLPVEAQEVALHGHKSAIRVPTWSA